MVATLTTTVRWMAPRGDLEPQLLQCLHCETRRVSTAPRATFHEGETM